MFKNIYKHIIIYMFILNVCLCGFNNCVASIDFKNNIVLGSNGLYLINFKEEVLDYKLSNPEMFKFQKPTAIFSNNTYLIKPLFKDTKSLLFIKTKTNNLVFNLETKAHLNSFSDKHTELFDITKIDEPPKIVN